MIRLMAFDLDGTLLNHESLIEPVVRAAVARARAAGITVTIATGRMFRSARTYAEQLALGGVPLVAYNGALIQHSSDERVWRHRPLSLAAARSIGRYLAGQGVHVNIYRGDDLYVEAANEITARYASRVGVEPIVAPGLLSELPWAPTKLLAVAAPEEILRLAADIRELVGDDVTLASSCPTFLEITGRGVNKGAALAELAAALAVPREEVLAAGDGQNDLEMIRYAGIGVAAHGAFPEVIAEADLVAGPGPVGMAEIIEWAASGRL